MYQSYSITDTQTLYIPNFSHDLPSLNSNSLSDINTFENSYIPLSNYASPSYKRRAFSTSVSLPSISELGLLNTDSLDENSGDNISTLYTKGSIIGYLVKSPRRTKTKSINTTIPRRKKAAPEQRQLLEDVFKSNFFPTTSTRMRLADELNMTERSVQIWFQNKRSAFRKTNKVHERVSPGIEKILKGSALTQCSTSSALSIASPTSSLYNKSDVLNSPIDLISQRNYKYRV